MPYQLIERRQFVAMHDDIERSTRQEVHPISTAVRPAPPAGARYRIEIWEPAIDNWGHYGFARNDAERSRLLASIRALSHRGRATPLDSSGARRPTSHHVRRSRVICARWR